MIEEVATGAATAAAKKSISAGVESIMKFVDAKFADLQIRTFKRDYLDYLAKHIVLKTLVRPEQAFHIDELYVPLRLVGELHTFPVIVDDGVTLDLGDRSLVIKGLAGQGKSTILRKLLSNAAKKGIRFPLFFELKTYQGGEIEEALHRDLTIAGVKLPPTAMPRLLSDSNVEVFLDAFDEVMPEYRAELLSEIRKLINGYKCKLVCTTRPDTELDTIVEVDIYRVEHLNDPQIFEIIRKTTAGTGKEDELESALKQSRFHSGQQHSILRSPILVVLFCASYNLGDQIPNTLSQFYANIFNAIFFRHDNLKGRVNRVRYWNDNHQIYRSIFDAICFASQRTGKGFFSEAELNQFVEQSLLYVGESKGVADRISSELRSITNLIIEDGYARYRFVHKSIQEFFSSCFVTNLSHEKKVKFYHRCEREPAFARLFSNTLFFLEEIDYYDYSNYFLIPGVDHLLSREKGPIPEDYTPSSELVSKIKDQIVISALYRPTHDKKHGRGVERRLFSPKSTDLDGTSSTSELLTRYVTGNIKIQRAEEEIVDVLVENGRPIGSDHYELSYRELAPLLRVDPTLMTSTVRSGVNLLFRETYNAALEKLESREESMRNSSFFEI